MSAKKKDVWTGAEMINFAYSNTSFRSLERIHERKKNTGIAMFCFVYVEIIITEKIYACSCIYLPVIHIHFDVFR